MFACYLGFCLSFGGGDDGDDGDALNTREVKPPLYSSSSGPRRILQDRDHS